MPQLWCSFAWVADTRGGLHDVCSLSAPHPAPLGLLERAGLPMQKQGDGQFSLRNLAPSVFCLKYKLSMNLHWWGFPALACIHVNMRDWYNFHMTVPCFHAALGMGMSYVSCCSELCMNLPHTHTHTRTHAHTHTLLDSFMGWSYQTTGYETSSLLRPLSNYCSQRTPSPTTPTSAWWGLLLALTSQHS